MIPIFLKFASFIWLLGALQTLNCPHWEHYSIYQCLFHNSGILTLLIFLFSHTCSSSGVHLVKLSGILFSLCTSRVKFLPLSLQFLYEFCYLFIYLTVLWTPAEQDLLWVPLWIPGNRPFINTCAIGNKWMTSTEMSKWDQSLE